MLYLLFLGRVIIMQDKPHSMPKCRGCFISKKSKECPVSKQGFQCCMENITSFVGRRGSCSLKGMVKIYDPAVGREAVIVVNDSGIVFSLKRRVFLQDEELALNLQ